MKKYSNIIIHIPHASLKYPQIFKNRIIINHDEFMNENIFMADYLVDKLDSKKVFKIIKFKYTRLFCDVERFRDDSLEPMSKKGMGAIYEKDSKGKKYVKIDDDYKNKILINYYDKHHRKIDTIVEKVLEKNSKCYIIDLHSFSDECVKRLLDLKNNPDICIGFDEKFNDKNLVNKTVEHFKKYGYTVKLNYPYSGSLVPNKYYSSNDDRVKSIMIEINKRIYLENNELSENFKKLKQCMDAYYEDIIGNIERG